MYIRNYRSGAAEAASEREAEFEGKFEQGREEKSSKFGENGVPRQPLRRVKIRQKRRSDGTPCPEKPQNAPLFEPLEGDRGGLLANFKLDDAVIGALLLLFLNQSSDDVMVLAFAYLLFIGM